MRTDGGDEQEQDRLLDEINIDYTKHKDKKSYKKYLKDGGWKLCRLQDGSIGVTVGDPVKAGIDLEELRPVAEYAWAQCVRWEKEQEAKG